MGKDAVEGLSPARERFLWKVLLQEHHSIAIECPREHIVFLV
jgi:hypothetical protein